MLSSNFIRWGAIATILAGLLSILIGIVNIIWYGDTWMSNVVETARWVVFGVALVGLYLYLRRSNRFGWVGAVGCYMLIVGCVLNTIVYGGLLPLEGGVAGVGALLISVGPVLFGIGILRAGRLPRAGAWLLRCSVWDV
jgi:hypothetical protein